MNQLVSLNNQAVECLLKGDAFEACNILMTMTTLYMQLSDQVHQTLAGSRRYHQHSNVKIQWVPFPTITTNERKDDYDSLFGTQRNVDCTDHQQYSYHHHQHQQDDDSSSLLLSSSSSPFVIHPYNHALMIRKTCCGGCVIRRQTTIKGRGGETNNTKAWCSETIVPEDSICMHCWDDYNVCPCTITPVMWYNLAITCQTLASQQQQQQQQQPSSSSTILSEEDNMFYLKRSLYLYQQAMDIIGPGPTPFLTGNNNGDAMEEDDSNNDTRNGNDDSSTKQQDFLEYYMNAALPRHRFIPTLRLAIWNNISSIYHTLGQSEYSTMGMQTLQLQLHRQQPLQYWGSTASGAGIGGGYHWFQEQQQQQRLQQDGTRIFYENIASFFHLSHGHPCVAGAA